MEKTPLSFKVEPEFKAALEYLAKQENRSLSNYVQTVLLRHLNDMGVDLDQFKDKPVNKSDTPKA